MARKKFNITTTTSENKDEENAIYKAKYLLNNYRCMPDVTKWVITDADTCEVLFVFENGNVEYIKGEFAKKLFN